MYVCVQRREENEIVRNITFVALYAIKLFLTTENNDNNNNNNNNKKNESNVIKQQFNKVLNLFQLLRHLKITKTIFTYRLFIYYFGEGHLLYSVLFHIIQRKIREILFIFFFLLSLLYMSHLTNSDCEHNTHTQTFDRLYIFLLICQRNSIF